MTLPRHRPMLKAMENRRLLALRFVAVTIGALVVGYLVAVFLYVAVIPLIVNG